MTLQIIGDEVKIENDANKKYHQEVVDNSCLCVAELLFCLPENVRFYPVVFYLLFGREIFLNVLLFVLIHKFLDEIFAVCK